MIILVKTKPLCIGKAWLPFQKCEKKLKNKILNTAQGLHHRFAFQNIQHLAHLVSIKIYKYVFTVKMYPYVKPSVILLIEVEMVELDDLTFFNISLSSAHCLD